MRSVWHSDIAEVEAEETELLAQHRGATQKSYKSRGYNTYTLGEDHDDTTSANNIPYANTYHPPEFEEDVIEDTYKLDEYDQLDEKNGHNVYRKNGRSDRIGWSDRGGRRYNNINESSGEIITTDLNDDIGDISGISDISMIGDTRKRTDESDYSNRGRRRHSQGENSTSLDGTIDSMRKLRNNTDSSDFGSSYLEELLRLNSSGNLKRDEYGSVTQYKLSDYESADLRESSNYKNIDLSLKSQSASLSLFVNSLSSILENTITVLEKNEQWDINQDVEIQLHPHLSNLSDRSEANRNDITSIQNMKIKKYNLYLQDCNFYRQITFLHYYTLFIQEKLDDEDYELIHLQGGNKDRSGERDIGSMSIKQESDINLCQDRGNHEGIQEEIQKNPITQGTPHHHQMSKLSQKVTFLNQLIKNTNPLDEFIPLSHFEKLSDNARRYNRKSQYQHQYSISTLQQSLFTLFNRRYSKKALLSPSSPFDPNIQIYLSPGTEPTAKTATETVIETQSTTKAMKQTESTLISSLPSYTWLEIFSIIRRYLQICLSSLTIPLEVVYYSTMASTFRQGSTIAVAVAVATNDKSHDIFDTPSTTNTDAITTTQTTTHKWINIHPFASTTDGGLYIQLTRHYVLLLPSIQSIISNEYILPKLLYCIHSVTDLLPNPAQLPISFEKELRVGENKDKEKERGSKSVLPISTSREYGLGDEYDRIVLVNAMKKIKNTLESEIYESKASNKYNGGEDGEDGEYGLLSTYDSLWNPSTQYTIDDIRGNDDMTGVCNKAVPLDDSEMPILSQYVTMLCHNAGIRKSTNDGDSNTRGYETTTPSTDDITINDTLKIPRIGYLYGLDDENRYTAIFQSTPKSDQLDSFENVDFTTSFTPESRVRNSITEYNHTLDSNVDDLFSHNSVEGDDDDHSAHNVHNTAENIKYPPLNTFLSYFPLLTEEIMYQDTISRQQFLHSQTISIESQRSPKPQKLPKTGRDERSEAIHTEQRMQKKQKLKNEVDTAELGNIREEHVRTKDSKSSTTKASDVNIKQENIKNSEINEINKNIVPLIRSTESSEGVIIGNTSLNHLHDHSNTNTSTSIPTSPDSIAMITIQWNNYATIPSFSSTCRCLTTLSPHVDINTVTTAMPVSTSISDTSLLSHPCTQYQLPTHIHIQSTLQALPSLRPTNAIELQDCNHALRSVSYLTTSKAKILNSPYLHPMCILHSFHSSHFDYIALEIERKARFAIRQLLMKVFHIKITTIVKELKEIHDAFVLVSSGGDNGGTNGLGGQREEDDRNHQMHTKIHKLTNGLHYLSMRFSIPNLLDSNNRDNLDRQDSHDSHDSQDNQENETVSSSVDISTISHTLYSILSRKNLLTFHKYHKYTYMTSLLTWLQNIAQVLSMNTNTQTVSNPGNVLAATTLYSTLSLVEDIENALFLHYCKTKLTKHAGTLIPTAATTTTAAIVSEARTFTTLLTTSTLSASASTSTMNNDNYPTNQVSDQDHDQSISTIISTPKSNLGIFAPVHDVQLRNPIFMSEKTQIVTSYVGYSRTFIQDIRQSPWVMSAFCLHTIELTYSSVEMSKSTKHVNVNKVIPINLSTSSSFVPLTMSYSFIISLERAMYMSTDQYNALQKQMQEKRQQRILKDNEQLYDYTPMYDVECPICGGKQAGSNNSNNMRNNEDNNMLEKDLTDTKRHGDEANIAPMHTVEGAIISSRRDIPKASIWGSSNNSEGSITLQYRCLLCSFTWKTKE